MSRSSYLEPQQVEDRPHQSAWSQQYTYHKCLILLFISFWQTLLISTLSLGLKPINWRKLTIQLDSLYLYPYESSYCLLFHFYWQHNHVLICKGLILAVIMKNLFARSQSHVEFLDLQWQTLYITVISIHFLPSYWHRISEEQQVRLQNSWASQHPKHSWLSWSSTFLFAACRTTTNSTTAGTKDSGTLRGHKRALWEKVSKQSFCALLLAAISKFFPLDNKLTIFDNTC